MILLAADRSSGSLVNGVLILNFWSPSTLSLVTYFSKRSMPTHRFHTWRVFISNGLSAVFRWTTIDSKIPIANIRSVPGAQLAAWAFRTNFGSAAASTASSKPQKKFNACQLASISRSARLALDRSPIGDVCPLQHRVINMHLFVRLRRVIGM